MEEEGGRVRASQAVVGNLTSREGTQVALLNTAAAMITCTRLDGQYPALEGGVAVELHPSLKIYV